MRHAPRTVNLALVMAWGTITVGMVANSAIADSIKIVGASDASVTGNAVNLYPPYSYGLGVNAYDGTHGIVDVPMAAVPLNATVNGVQVNFQEISYANANGLVTVSGYGRTGSIKSSDGVGVPAVGTYNSIALGLGQHSVALNSTGVSLVSSLLGTRIHLGLAFTAGSSDTNTAVGSVEQSAFFTPPSVTVSYDLPTNPKFVPMLDANITGTTVNQFNPSTYGMVINAFDTSKSVLDYSLAAMPASSTVATATITFDETSYANASGLVSIYAYSRSGPITGADGSAVGTLIGSYNSISLGTGNHTIALNPAGLSAIQSLLGSSQDLGLRFVAGSNDTNTQFGSLEQSPGFTAPVLSLTFFAPGDVTHDGIVNAQDIGTIGSHWLQSGPGVPGDATGDGFVNAQDIGAIASHWLWTNQGAPGAGTAVPEPGSMALLAVGTIGLAVVAWRRARNQRQI